MAAEEVGLLSLMVEAGWQKIQARRLVKQGAVRIDEERILDERASVSLRGDGATLRQTRICKNSDRIAEEEPWQAIVSGQTLNTKGRADAARGKVFSKISKEIMVAAAAGGGNVDDNIQLRALVQKAKGVSMPKENIERAIKKGTGELEGGRLEEGSYEGYAAGGIAVVVKVLSDNKNRSASEVRHAFSKHGANLAEQGAVSRMFQRRGQIRVVREGVDEERLLELMLECGADDLKTAGDHFEIVTEPATFDAVSDALTQAGIEMEHSEITWIPDVITEVTTVEQARSIMKFIEALEELDDVQDVYANFDISDEVYQTLDAE